MPTLRGTQCPSCAIRISTFYNFWNYLQFLIQQSIGKLRKLLIKLFNVFFFIIAELLRYITCLGLTLIATSLTLSFSLLQFLILIPKPQAISASLVSFGFALYYASGFAYSSIIIKLLIRLGIYNIAVYIKQKVTIKVEGFCTVASQRYTSITLVLNIVRGQLLER